MKLIDGKFYDEEGNIVPLQFGDKEQIRLIQLQEKKMSALTDDGLVVKVSTEKIYTHRIMFMCVCNECNVYAEAESEYCDDFDDLIGKETCFKCKRQYNIERDKNGVFTAKLIS